MPKYEVLEKVSLVVEKGSIVELTERQYELARAVLKKVAEPKKEKVAKEEK